MKRIFLNGSPRSSLGSLPSLLARGGQPDSRGPAPSARPLPPGRARSARSGWTWVYVSLFVLVFASWIRAAGDEVPSKELSRLVETLDVDPGETFADVGAGDGRYSVALARTVGESGRIYATEVDPDDLKKIEDRVSGEKLSNVEVVRGTQEATGLSEACCDGILLRRVYHHFQNPAAMQASMRHALKEGGLLLIIDFGTRRSWSRPEGVPASRTGHGIDKDLLVSEMEHAGFALLRDFPWEEGDYALLFHAVAVPD